MANCKSDLLVIGGGPAGLSAAINGASEGLSVRLIDNGLKLGGQARESSAIENYPGFPDGITGDELMSRFVRQAYKFQTHLLCPAEAAKLEPLDSGSFRVYTTDYDTYEARAVLLANGLNYRRLGAQNLAQFVGRGAYYGIPQVRPKPGKRNILIIGGANSAGQATVNLAADKRNTIKLVIRKTIGAGMSQYLIDRISKLSNVEVCEDCEVKAVSGDICLKVAQVLNKQKMEHWPVDAMYIFIGAVPRTLWLQGTLELDARKYIVTGDSAYQTSLEGVFAAGDIHSGSTKRIATAIGEGAGALQMIHRFLGS